MLSAAMNYLSVSFMSKSSEQTWVEASTFSRKNNDIIGESNTREMSALGSGIPNVHPCRGKTASRLLFWDCETSASPFHNYQSEEGLARHLRMTTGRGHRIDLSYLWMALVVFY